MSKLKKNELIMNIATISQDFKLYYNAAKIGSDNSNNTMLFCVLQRQNSIKHQLVFSISRASQKISLSIWLLLDGCLTTAVYCLGACFSAR